jgi:LacI family transcriptional regulator/LacI family repressor for deo operon, udp, cdd, tsx, nupC, and nupG
MQKKRVTQKDIAEASGFHRATVSLALKHHPSLPKSTRDHILNIAEKLGYRPDPVLSALTAYRNNNQSRSFQGTMAWLVLYDEQSKHDWKSSNLFMQYHEGAKEQADKYGYQLEIFEFDPSKISYKRMASILKARNVNGILLCPQNSPFMTMEFDWDSFSFVTFGYSLMKPKLHTVTATQYRSMVQTMTMMHEREHRRIAFMFNPTHDRRADHNYLAGYLMSQHLIGETPIVLDYRYSQMSEFKAELIQRRKEGIPLDALVSGNQNIAKLLKQAGVSAPEDIAVACPLLNTQDTTMSGIYEDSVHIGRIAVDHLNNMLLRGERGIPNKALRIHVEGLWHEGKTLPTKRPV